MYLCTSLENLTWKQINGICELGLHHKFFKIGDTKTITLHNTEDNTTYDIIMVLVAMDTDVLAENPQKTANLTFLSKTPLPSKGSWYNVFSSYIPKENSTFVQTTTAEEGTDYTVSNSTYKLTENCTIGYPQSNIRMLLQNEDTLKKLLGVVPEIDLLNNIKSVQKISSLYNLNSNVLDHNGNECANRNTPLKTYTTTEPYLWLPGENDNIVLSNDYTDILTGNVVWTRDCVIKDSKEFLSEPQFGKWYNVNKKISNDLGSNSTTAEICFGFCI